MRRHWKHGTFVNKDDSQQTSDYDPFQLIRILTRKITPSRILFILNVFATVVFQLAIAFGLTALVTQVSAVSHLALLHHIIFYVISAIYFSLEFIWAFVRRISMVFPWNLVYLLVMTILSSIIIAAESLAYYDDVPLIVFAFIWVMLQVVVSFAIFIPNDFTQTWLTRIVNVVYTVTILGGQIAFFVRKQAKVALLIAGAVGFPCSCYLLAKEVKWIFGQGTYYYPQNNIVKPARNIYGYCWSLFLTVMWIYSPFGMRNETIQSGR
uniref:Uncharacterized protein n=1 Tax=Trichobilharzia regenti TaxID=157069 RepID=A0AA85JMH8_TRIRE|nr:unnamed protein product [Trichobilharzia regenti]